MQRASIRIKKVKSKLRFHKQEKIYSCAVACLKMILAYFGRNISEEELRKLCNTTEQGTFAGDIVLYAKNLGFKAEKKYLSINEMRELMRENIFPIIYVNTYFLNNVFATHAMIVEEFMDDKVVIMDPAEGRITLSIEVLEKIWDICNNLAILIGK